MHRLIKDLYVHKWMDTATQIWISNWRLPTPLFDHILSPDTRILPSWIFGPHLSIAPVCSAGEAGMRCVFCVLLLAFLRVSVCVCVCIYDMWIYIYIHMY